MCSLLEVGNLALGCLLTRPQLQILVLFRDGKIALRTRDSGADEDGQADPPPWGAHGGAEGEDQCSIHVSRVEL